MSIGVLGDVTSSCLTLASSKNKDNNPPVSDAVTYLYNGKCYYIGPTASNWDNAYDICRNLHDNFDPPMDYGRMAVFENNITFNIVMEKMLAIIKGDYNSSEGMRYGNLDQLPIGEAYRWVWLGAKSNNLSQFCWQSAKCGPSGTDATELVHSIQANAITMLPYCLVANLDTANIKVDSCSAANRRLCELGKKHMLDHITFGWTSCTCS